MPIIGSSFTSWLGLLWTVCLSPAADYNKDSTHCFSSWELHKQRQSLSQWKYRGRAHDGLEEEWVCTWKRKPSRKRLQRQHGAQSVGVRPDPKHPPEKQATALHACNPSSGKAERGSPKACWPIGPVKLVSLQVQGEVLSNIWLIVIKEDTQCQLLASICTYTIRLCTYIYYIHGVYMLHYIHSEWNFKNMPKTFLTELQQNSFIGSKSIFI